MDIKDWLRVNIVYPFLILVGGSLLVLLFSIFFLFIYSLFGLVSLEGFRFMWTIIGTMFISSSVLLVER